MNKKILFFYDYFYPGYKAGGPIQSLANLVITLQSDYDVSVVTSAYDLRTLKPYEGIKINSWNKVNILGQKKAVDVYYLDKSALKISSIILEVSPQTIYLNGIYSLRFFLTPLLLFKARTSDIKIVVCPRGMLQKGALAAKPFKKKFYLYYLRFSGLLKNVCWQANNKEEADDIRKHFPINKGILIAPNIPRAPSKDILFPYKEKLQLKLIYLSLIAEKKNLLLLLRLLQHTHPNITLHIYGPIIDKKYGNECVVLVKQMSEKVKYKGEVQPEDVPGILSQYHALILLTKGENFGHALYESLSVGRPIITSHFTPWNNLQQYKAGVNVDINSIEDCLQKINDFGSMKQEEYNTFCTGAHNLACTYFDSLDAKHKYRELFA